MIRTTLLLAAGTLALSGCASTSFAPPPVNWRQVMTAASLSPDCRLTTENGGALSENVAGAIQLIDNYRASYECVRDVAADGRQAFQVPAFLALVGSTTAVALGAGPDVAIAGGAANATFTAGNNYYSPLEQAEIIGDALTAISCIRRVAVDTPAYTIIPEVANEQRRALAAMALTGGQTEVSADVQYFNAIKGVLEDVADVATTRLIRRGSFDAAGVAAQVQTLADEVRRREAERTAGLTAQQGLMTSRKAQMVQLDLRVLQPRLEQCVLRAKA